VTGQCYTEEAENLPLPKGAQVVIVELDVRQHVHVLTAHRCAACVWGCYNSLVGYLERNVDATCTVVVFAEQLVPPLQQQQQ
jgi:hypothetical protein